ncbi:MAG: nucleotide exchange factor GrpE [Haloarculaceae archaeon]
MAAEAVHPPADVAPDGREAAFEPAELELEDEFVERVADADPETVAGEIATLQLRVAALEGETAELEAEIEDLESRLARKQADVQNYKKRQQRRLEEEKQRATEDLVARLLDVRDNLERALEQDEGADIRGGVESTLRQFDEEFEREDVSVIEPEPGDATDPQHHEVLMRVESDQPADTVAQVHRPGYEMAGKVLRPAQVTVSEGPPGTGANAGSAGEKTDASSDPGQSGS